MNNFERKQVLELIKDSDFHRDQVDTLVDLQEQRIKLLEEKIALYEVMIAKYKERGDVYRDLLVRLHPEFGDRL